MSFAERFEDLEIWKLSRELSKNTYIFIRKNDFFSKDFSLKDQIKRSSGSVMDNIAEGFGRGGNAEFVYFLSIASGSIQEYKSQLYRAFDYSYLVKSEFDEIYFLADKIGKMIAAFIQYLKKSGIKGEKFKKHPEKSILKEPIIKYGIDNDNFSIEQNDDATATSLAKN